MDFDDYASNPDDDGDVNVLVDDDGGQATLGLGNAFALP